MCSLREYCFHSLHQRSYSFLFLSCSPWHIEDFLEFSVLSTGKHGSLNQNLFCHFLIKSTFHGTLLKESNVDLYATEIVLLLFHQSNQVINWIKEYLDQSFMINIKEIQLNLSLWFDVQMYHHSKKKISLILLAIFSSIISHVIELFS